MGLKRVSWVRRYQGQCQALRPLGHQGYRLRNHKKDQPLCSGYTKEVRKVVVESHLVVLDVEKESMPLKQEKNGVTKDKYRTCSRTSKKNGNREANLTQFPTLGLSGRKQSPSK